jgi:hypothetical protein
MMDRATLRTEADRSAHEASAASLWTWAALAVALAGVAGSLSLSLVLGLKACPLCFYQRAFVMSVAGVLIVGLCTGGARGTRLGLLALPLATAGLGVAFFHEFLEGKGALECPAGLLGLGTAPQQSLGVFLVLFVLVLADAVTGPVPAARRGLAVTGALVLGALLAVGSCVSNPPMPGAPREPYAGPPEICRPPYHIP